MRERTEQSPRTLFTPADRSRVSAQIVADLPNVRSILDCGSRDGALLRSIAASRKVDRMVAVDWYNRFDSDIRFVRHNLEEPLDIPDRAFDVVICNDVLEHLERKNACFQELFRITNRHLIISLPNTQYYKYIKGLIRGHMSKHYDFSVDDNVDRHRWITYYHQNIAFAKRFIPDDFSLVSQTNTMPSRRVPRWIAQRFPVYFVFNQIFLFSRLQS
jgi:SAM-dependent methyltransferase